MAKVDNLPGDETALGQIGQYYKNNIERQGKLDTAMLLFVALSIAQLIIYYGKAREYVKRRDRVIGEYDDDIGFDPDDDREDGKYRGMLNFLWYLENTRDTVDFPILEEKAAVKDDINFQAWEPNACQDSVIYLNDIKNDSDSINELEQFFAECSCSGAPDGWGMHDASLALGLGAAYIGPIMTSAAVNRYEEFKEQAISIVQQAQSAIKAIYNIGTIMQYYSQSYGIYAGVADLFIQGFNSAGAMLGTALGQLGSSSATGKGSGTVINTGNVAAGSGSGGSTPITIGWRGP